jgi:aminopeptidase N
VEKLKNKPLSEKAVFMAETAIWGILYSKRGNCFQLKNENFEGLATELALATNNIQVRQAVAITNKKSRGFQSAIWKSTRR